MMNWIDYAIIAVIVISMIFSLLRGFVREVLSLIVWLCAFFIAGRFYLEVVPYLTMIHNEFARSGAAIILLFIVVLIIGGIITSIISRLIDKVGLSSVDRLLGIIFGFFRGVLLISVVLLGLMMFTSFAKFDEWQQAVLIPHFVHLIDWFFAYFQLDTSLVA